MRRRRRVRRGCLSRHGCGPCSGRAIDGAAPESGAAGTDAGARNCTAAITSSGTAGSGCIVQKSWLDMVVGRKDAQSGGRCAPVWLRRMWPARLLLEALKLVFPALVLDLFHNDMIALWFYPLRLPMYRMHLCAILGTKSNRWDEHAQRAFAGIRAVLGEFTSGLDAPFARTVTIRSLHE
jgi:hypothetical protein